MYLFGASGHGKVIFDILKLTGYKVEGFIDQDQKKTEWMELPVIHDTSSDRWKAVSGLIAVGDNAVRKRIAAELPMNWIRAIHPGAIVANSSFVEVGTAVMAGSVINISSMIGKHVIVNTRASIDHDCHLGDFVHIAPGVTVCGGIQIGEGTLIGAGATILPNVTIGKWCVIAAGAVVTDDVEDHCMVAGIPAIKRKNLTIR